MSHHAPNFLDTFEEDPVGPVFSDEETPSAAHEPEDLFLTSTIESETPRADDPESEPEWHEPIPTSSVEDVSVSVVPLGTRQMPFWVRIIAWLVIVGIIAIFSWFAYGVIRVGISVAAVRSSLQAMQQSARTGNLAGAAVQLDETATALRDVQDRLMFFAGWERAPFIGGDIHTLQDVTDAGTQVVIGGQHILRAAVSFEQALAGVGLIQSTLTPGIAPTRRFTDISIEEKRELLRRLQDTLPELRLAREEFAIAADSWAQTGHDERVLQLVPAAARFTQELPTLKRQADQAISFLEVFLPLAGASGRQNYLVLLQNADELRATGGFMGTIGFLGVNAAHLEDLKFEDVYAIDNPVSGVWTDVPPEPLKRELGVSAWFLRDRNWSPDFPTAAYDIMRTYEREKALVAMVSTTVPVLDGVIALQPDLFTKLLEFTGPVTVDGKIFNSHNFFDLLEYNAEIGFLSQGLTVDQRKDIVLKVGDALTAKLMATPASRWGDLLDLLTERLERKDILFTMRNPQTMKLLDGRGWTGRALATPQDYLWVIDSNLAALKTDGVMDKKIEYHLDMTAAGGPIGTVTLRYHNTNRTIDWRYTRYRDYVRVYVPEGSTLLSSAGAMYTDRNLGGGRIVPGTVDIMHDLGKTVFGAFWAIEPGETRTLTFTYRLPDAVLSTWRAQQRYQLLVQKQPGARIGLTVDHAFGKNIRSAVPGEATRNFGDTNYTVFQPLEQDQSYDIRF